MSETLAAGRPCSVWGPRAHRHFLTRLLTIAGTLVALFAIAAIWFIEHDRQLVEAERQAYLQAELDLIESELEARLTALVVVMEAVRERVTAQNTADGLHDYLTRMAQATSGFRTILTTDRMGLVRSDLRPGQPALGLDLSHREHVRHHFAEPAAALLVGSPIKSRVDGNVTLPLSVASRRDDGELVGVITGAIETASMLARFGGSFRDDKLFLVHDDGTILGHLSKEEVSDAAWRSMDAVLADASELSVLYEYPVTAPRLARVRTTSTTSDADLPLRLVVVGSDAWARDLKMGSVLFASGFFLVASSLVGLIALAAFRFAIQQRRAREEVARVNRSLREAERLAKIGTWTWKLPGPDLDWSKGTFEIFGEEYTEVNGVLGSDGGTVERDWYLSRIHPEDRPDVEAKIQASITTGTAYSSTYRAFRSNDDQLIHVRSDAFVEVDEADVPVRVSGLIQDITDDIETFEALERARAAAEVGLQVREDFIAMISHEIRTPLNAILGYSGLIADPPAGLDLPADRRRAYMQNLEQATNSILALVEQVLDMTRLRTGEATPTIDRLQVAEIVERVLMICKPSMQPRGITVDHNIDRDVWILCDAPMIDRALLNILSNAEKYSPEGGHIAIRMTTEGQFARLTVTDAGTGIPTKDLERLAQPFVRLDPAYAYRTQGTGLGLAIAKLIMERNGGQLQIDSEVGRGTTVTLTLPMEPA